MKAKKRVSQIPIKRPLQVNCFKCSSFFEVKWNTGSGKHVEKNHWYYWTGKEENQGKYICDNCLVRMYKNKKDRWEYLENITDQGRRQILRTYVATWKKYNLENTLLQN
jgi:hypothetical protein